MNIIISNSSGKPIYEQITFQLKQLILTGELKPHDMLPSMRLLAKELRISVITTKRAYEDLERDGFIYTVVGKGSFVADTNQDILREEHLRQVEDYLELAVEQARQCLPDIVISDIKMPHMDGIQMAAAIREFCPHCQLIFLSGYSDKEYLKGAIKLKAANYVEKPIDLEEIEQALSEVIKELDEQQKEESPDTRRILFFRGNKNSDTPPNTAIFQGSQSHIRERLCLKKQNETKQNKKERKRKSQGEFVRPKLELGAISK